MFLSQLFESTIKHAAFCFGRMNPPTLGHGQLIDTVAQAAQGGDYFVFASGTQDKKKNPLDYATKIKFLRALFPEQASHVVNDPTLKTIMQVADWLYAQGYSSVTFVAGSDRLDSFKKCKHYGSWGVDLKPRQYYRFKALCEKLKKVYESYGSNSLVIGHLSLKSVCLSGCKWILKQG